MTQFLLIRHGEPQWSINEENKLKGFRRDFVPLTERGVSEAEAVALDPLLDSATVLVSSPYTRSLQTAAIISRRRNLPLHVEYNLHEWTPDLNGKFETMDELQAIHRDYLACGGVYPEGEQRGWETTDGVRRRTLSVLRKYLSYDSVAVVCHGMVIHCLTGQEVQHCGVVELEVT